jgi:hypothetical protein
MRRYRRKLCGVRTGRRYKTHLWTCAVDAAILQDMAHSLTTAHWLMRAAEAQQLADEQESPQAKRTMALVATGYERLAAFHKFLHQIDVPMENSPPGKMDTL